MGYPKGKVSRFRPRGNISNRFSLEHMDCHSWSHITNMAKKNMERRLKVKEKEKLIWKKTDKTKIILIYMNFLKNIFHVVNVKSDPPCISGFSDTWVSLFPHIWRAETRQNCWVWGFALCRRRNCFVFSYCRGHNVTSEQLGHDTIYSCFNPRHPASHHIPQPRLPAQHSEATMQTMSIQSLIQ